MRSGKNYAPMMKNALTDQWGGTSDAYRSFKPSTTAVESGKVLRIAGVEVGVTSLGGLGVPDIKSDDSPTLLR